MRVRRFRRFMFLALYLLFSQFLIDAGAAEDVGLIVSGLRGNEKLVAADEILADFDQGAPETAVIVQLQPSDEAKALAVRSRSSQVPPEFTGPGAAIYYNLQDESIRSQLHATVSATVNQALVLLGGEGITAKRKFSYIFGFAAKVTPAALARIVALPEVVSVEKDQILQAHLAQGIPLIRASAVRNSYTGSGLSIAICDTGIDTSHPMLGGGGFPNAKVIGGYDTGDNDSDPRPDSSSGHPHGTACAGIAAGSPGAVGDYIGGVAPEAKLYAIKISTGDSGMSEGSAMIVGWEWAITHKNDDPGHPIMIISTSFGGGLFSSTCDSFAPTMAAAAANAVAAGITIFASSGNDGYCRATAFPACLSYVNSVGAVYDTTWGSLGFCVSASSCASKVPATWCNSGWWTSDSPSPDSVTGYSNSAWFLTLLAPSHMAYTTDIVGAGGYSTGDFSPVFGGTSAACPYAAGAAAVLQHAAREKSGAYLTPAEVRAYLVNNGDYVTDTKADIAKPRINLENAVGAVTGSGPPNFGIAVSPDPVSVAPGDTAVANIATTISGGFDNPIWLSVAGLPAEVMLALDPSIPAPGTGSTSLTLFATPAAPPGSYAVTVTGTGGGVTRITTFTLTITALFIEGFEETAPLADCYWSRTQGGVSPAPSPHSGYWMAAFLASYASGQCRFYTSAFAVPGSAATITLSFWMYHDTDSATDENIQVQASTDGSTWSNVGAPIPRYDGTNGWALVTRDLSAYRGEGNLRLGFVGTSYRGTRNIYLDDVSVVALSPDFTIAASPTSGTVSPGRTVDTTLTTTVSGGFNHTVALAVTGLPAGATATFSPPSIAAPGAGTSTMTVTTTTAVAAGEYAVTVTGSGGGFTRTATFTLNVTPPLQITTDVLPNAAVNKPYSVTMAAANGREPYYWFISGIYDTGISIDSGTGVISGTLENVVPPDSAFATLAVTVTVMDSGFEGASKEFLLRVNQSAPAAPTDLVATAVPLSGVLLTWRDNANNETGYQIQRATNASFTAELTATYVSGTALTTYTDYGVVSGTTYFYRVRSGNYVAWSTEFSNTASVTLLAVSTTSLPDGAVNVPYNKTVSAVGGSAPYSWSAAGLPLGVSMDAASGSISGTPANVVPANAYSATFAVTVSVTDRTGITANAALTLKIHQTAPAAPSGLTATPASPNRVLLTWNDNANNDLAVQVQRAATADFSTGLTVVTLYGTTLDSYTDNSVLPGRTYYYRVRSGNYVSWSATFSDTATATTSALLAVSTTSLANGAVNAAYSQTVAATGGTAPYSWSATGLPAGFAINQESGVISGTPGNVVQVNAYYATFPVAVTVTDGAGAIASASFSLRINQSAPAAPSVLAAAATLPTRVLLTWNDNANNETVVQVQRSAVADFSTGVTSVTLHGTALTSYTDNTVLAGSTYHYRVRCGNYVAWSAAFSNTATATTQTAPLAISTTSLANGAVNSAYSQAVSATGGIAPYNWSATGLPSGLSIAPASGVISGTPANVVPANSYFATLPVTITVSDGASATATASLSIRINQTAPAAPSGLSATAASPTRVVLSWSDNANNESVVQVQRATNAGFSTGLTSVTLYGTALTGYNDNSAVPGTTYYYRVRSGNYVAWSTTFSDTAMVTTP